MEMIARLFCFADLIYGAVSFEQTVLDLAVHSPGERPFSLRFIFLLHQPVCAILGFSWLGEREQELWRQLSLLHSWHSVSKKRGQRTDVQERASSELWIKSNCCLRTDVRVYICIPQLTGSYRITRCVYGHFKSIDGKDKLKGRRRKIILIGNKVTEKTVGCFSLRMHMYLKTLRPLLQKCFGAW